MPCRRTSLRAFTLMEIMMVVGIMGLMMTIGVPAILRTTRQEPMRKAVNDVMEICSHARGQAILHNVTMAVVFHPQSRQVALASVTPPAPPADNQDQSNIPAGGSAPPTSGTSSLNSAQFADSITIDMLDINLLEYKDAEEARVRFFPNGTSDEMTLILHSKDQYREITLEVTTGLASVGEVR
jgi:prepilin-type N-terminal cleavage/methylation domain-containing protein